MVNHLIQFAHKLDSNGKFAQADRVLAYVVENDNLKKYFDDLRQSFIDFMIDVVMKDFITDHPDRELNSESVIKYYFEKREDYEEQLDGYELLMGQTEGILSDESFASELNIENDCGPMNKSGD